MSTYDCTCGRTFASDHARKIHISRASDFTQRHYPAETAPEMSCELCDATTASKRKNGTILCDECADKPAMPEVPPFPEVKHDDTSASHDDTAYPKQREVVTTTTDGTAFYRVVDYRLEAIRAWATAARHGYAGNVNAEEVFDALDRIIELAGF